MPNKRALALAIDSFSSGLSYVSSSSRPECIESADMPRVRPGASDRHRVAEDGRDDDVNSKRVARGDADEGREEAYEGGARVRFLGRFRCRGEEDRDNEFWYEEGPPNSWS